MGWHCPACPVAAAHNAGSCRHKTDHEERDRGVYMTMTQHPISDQVCSPLPRGTRMGRCLAMPVLEPSGHQHLRVEHYNFLGSCIQKPLRCCTRFSFTAEPRQVAVDVNSVDAISPEDSSRACSVVALHRYQLIQPGDQHIVCNVCSTVIADHQRALRCRGAVL
jgi:hypothetical protein